MKATVRSGLVWGTEDEARVSRELVDRLGQQGYAPEQVDLVGIKPGDCRACFGCWNVTPGECCRRDTAGKLAGKAAGADLIVLLASVRFGSFSAPVEKVGRSTSTRRRVPP
jgi:multimeric flavodoxin WrbA